MARGRMTWKFKILIVFVVGSIVLMAAALTPWGHDAAESWMRSSFESMPEDQRRTSIYADGWLALAWWTGNICQDTKRASRLYLEFCGAAKDEKGRDFMQNKLELIGMCSKDGMTGWGPYHPRAVEAYFNYLVISETEKSSTFYNEDLFRFYYLFYTWCSIRGEKRVPECFEKYFNKVLQQNVFKRIEWPADIDRKIPKAPKSPESC
jgi:hypothetical protein